LAFRLWSKRISSSTRTRSTKSDKETPHGVFESCLNQILKFILTSALAGFAVLA
jgi:hypothetical protein